MTARQLAEDYLAHQITRDVTRTSTRHHLNQLLALFGGWQHWPGLPRNRPVIYRHGTVPAVL